MGKPNLGLFARRSTRRPSSHGTGRLKWGTERDALRERGGAALRDDELGLIPGNVSPRSAVHGSDGVGRSAAPPAIPNLASLTETAQSPLNGSEAGPAHVKLAEVDLPDVSQFPPGSLPLVELLPDRSTDGPSRTSVAETNSPDDSPSNTSSSDAVESGEAREGASLFLPEPVEDDAPAVNWPLHSRNVPAPLAYESPAIKPSVTSNAAPSVSPGTDRRGPMRSLMESAVCLILTVLLFRQYAAEGYMISTGSMAPALYGFHQRVACPRCRFPFALGVAFDESDDEADRDARQRTTCPNCGQASLDVSQIPRNHGDQLLVDKQAFTFRPPRRWEVVVFRNPERPEEAYVKRAAGLPGERLEIREGDVWINGRLERKPWSVQQQMRILVHDHAYRPAGESGVTRWHIEAMDAEADDMPPGWTARDDGFEISHSTPAVGTPDSSDSLGDAAAPHWVAYRQRAAWGGSVPLSYWPRGIDPDRIPPIGLKFDASKRRLSCVRALPTATRDYLKAAASEPEFLKAIDELYLQSQFAPVSDRYAYNASETYTEYQAVRDAMASLRLSTTSTAGQFYLVLSDGETSWTTRFDFGKRQVELFVSGAEESTQVGELPDAFQADSTLIEMSLIDQQVIVAVNGSPLWDPLRFETSAGVRPPGSAMRFGAEGLSARVDQLRVYRDVYYTSNRCKHAVNRPVQLADDEYFVLGDNSPLSHDSRRWNSPGVKSTLLIGRPFLVHLPSKPGRLKLGDREFSIRLPDWDRVRRIP